MKKSKGNFWQKLGNTSEPKPSGGGRRSHIPFRLNFLFFIIFGLFIALIIQLGYLQIVNGKNITKQLEEYSVVKVSGSSPRGVIYDATGKPLVENEANSAITFTRGSRMTADDLRTLAEKLNQLIEVSIPDKLKDAELGKRDKIDYWLADKDNFQKAYKRLTDKEQAIIKADSSKEYELVVAKVKEDEIAFSDEELQATAIFTTMNSATALNTVFIKNRDVSDEELAIVAERASELPGISTGTDWSRKYAEENGSIRSILGTVSATGLQKEDAEEYLAKGYARNDRVGTSYLEKQYEEVLQGTKSQSEITLDRNGNISSQKQVFEGEKGDNLKMTINSEFQKKVEEIVKRNYQVLIDNGKAAVSPGVYAVAMNPNTGGVLAMVGYSHEKDSKKLQEHALGTITSSFVPGSVVKAGTLAAGWQNGALKGNETLYDQPLYIKGTPVKASIYNKKGEANRDLDARKALEISSNSYMVQVVLKMMGLNYSQDMEIMGVAKQGPLYNELRNAMAEFGLGVKTGIDLPNEASGIQTPVRNLDPVEDGGKILDISFGQFDTYTPMQLAQYVSTIANGGKKIQPHVVSGIYGNDAEGNIGSLVKKIEPTVLDTVDLSTEQMAIIRGGFYDAVHGTDIFATATKLKTAKMDLAAKTGTAETSAYGETTINSNIVAYGPVENPEIAISVVLPFLSGEDQHINSDIAKEIMDAYYDLFMADR
ncbi:penicillin-binding transpeptidase domain-containing protein [Enterococcus diestrammenae]|uniref:penicillin-binding transpeptidase domain-containing protein n=1 Tax=Enterococcus diestrammenae TaxID=1155073 RepID=UPI001F960F4D|nr:penicillin-binding transpeptidase domain-containing protein [Enterococcus diestrammenae]HIX69576.1 penicillin-binding protein 2 [Candidatus Enterococcus stercoravium]